MDKTQKPKTKIFVDYIPAELKENSYWYIAFHALNPFTEKLERKRIRVRKIKSVTERRKFAKKQVSEINKRLENGWNPFIEASKSKQFTLLKKASQTYLNQIQVEFRDKNLSLDTKKTYNSRLKNLLDYLENNDKENIYCYQFTNELILQFLDYLRYTKGVSSRTRDNYFTFLFTFSEWLLNKKYINYNPCIGIKKIHKKKNEKFTISTDVRIQIFDYYNATNINFLVFCLTCYYCLIRRTELSKIKVDDINLKNKTIYIKSEDAKTNTSAHVSIPKNLETFLFNHIKDAKLNDYVFSNDNFKPGQERFKPNKATSNWQRMRKKLKIDSKIKWYWLKDTGIVDLILKGVPLNSVRDQARHHNISQTNDYIPKSFKVADDKIVNSGLKF